MAVRVKKADLVQHLHQLGVVDFARYIAANYDLYITVQKMARYLTWVYGANSGRTYLLGNLLSNFSVREWLNWWRRQLAKALVEIRQRISEHHDVQR